MNFLIPPSLSGCGVTSIVMAEVINEIVAQWVRASLRACVVLNMSPRTYSITVLVFSPPSRSLVQGGSLLTIRSTQPFVRIV